MTANILSDQRNVGSFHLTFDDPVLLFDGAAQLGNCGARGVIFLNQNHFYTFCLNCGKGTNIRAELLALWCVARVANLFVLANIKIYGDSRVMIKWAKGAYDLKVMNLVYWCNRTQMELRAFSSLTLEHIYREFNS